VLGVRGFLDHPERGELALEQLVPHQAPVLVVRFLVLRVRGWEEPAQAGVVGAHDVPQLVGQRAQ
jgi:hypothetical protein